MQEIATNLLKSKLPALLEKFPEAILDAEDHCGDLSVVVRPDSSVEVIRFLKEELDYKMMIDLFGMDYLKIDPPTLERFAVVYILYSLSTHKHLRLKVYLSEFKPEIDSIHFLYKAANWFEREAWDLFGIRFRNHPHLTRILCHDDFVGHPLRKDYPADGYQRLKEPITSTEL